MAKKSKKNVRKKFFPVEVPLTAADVQLYASSPEELKDRVVKIDMTKALRGKSFELKLKIILDENGNPTGSPMSLSLLNSFIKRMIRRGSSYVEDSFSAECRDVMARIKPLLVTRRKVSRSVRKALREEAKKEILAYTKSRTSNEIFSDMMANKIQKQLSQKLKKIYPLALCEIRTYKIERQKTEDEKPAVKDNISEKAEAPAQ